MLRGDERLLIVKPSSLGDVIQTIPVIAGIKRTHPNVHITWIINSDWTPLVANLTCVDHALPFP
ncbi:MAG: glycosyltransferase family 9 protein, partial [Verrucomicrobiota bacterium]